MGAGLTDKALTPAFGGASSSILPGLTDGTTALRVLARNARLLLRETGENAMTDPLQSLKKYMPHFFSLYLPVVTWADNINGPMSYAKEEPMKGCGYDWNALIPLLKNLYRDSQDVCEALDMTARIAAHEEEWKAMIRSRIKPAGVDDLRQYCERLYLHEAPINQFYAGESRTFAPSLVCGA